MDDEDGGGFTPSRQLTRSLGFNQDVTEESLIQGLAKQNFGGAMAAADLRNECAVAFKKSWRGSQRTTVVVACSHRMRDAMVKESRLYVGWEVIEPTDYIEVTCCRRCQQYGHPEKYCRGPQVCGKCGEEGHGKEACSGSVERCATCARFGRPSADHRTMARECPARRHAEQRAVATTQYGSAN
jgi:hypothetical protein